jgi:hypothetical protein
MRNHHTKNKGDLGVLKAQADLAEQGFTVLIPLTEHAAFDVVAYRTGTFKRIQVKYRSAKNGTVSIRFRSTWSDSNGMHTKEIDKSKVDLFCVYCLDTDACYYLDPCDFSQAVRLRVRPPKNNQNAKVNFADDFRTVP